MKFLEKFQKNCYNFLLVKWGREGLGAAQRDPPRLLTMCRRGVPPGRAQAWCGVPLALHFLLFLSFSFSLPKNTIPLLALEFLLFLLAIFDLLAQPIVSAEIWSICSPVCDSSDCPSRILFKWSISWVFCCRRWHVKCACMLVLCFDKLFWCMFSPLISFYSILLHLFVSKLFFMRVAKISEKKDEQSYLWRNHWERSTKINKVFKINRSI